LEEERKVLDHLLENSKVGDIVSSSIYSRIELFWEEEKVWLILDLSSFAFDSSRIDSGSFEDWFSTISSTRRSSGLDGLDMRF